MAHTFTVKQNDLLPVIAGVLKDRNGVVDLTTANTIRFIMRPATGGTLKVDSPAVFDGPRVDGGWSYAWQDGDTDTPGFFDFEVEVTFPGPKTLTFPNRGYSQIEVEDDLG